MTIEVRSKRGRKLQYIDEGDGPLILDLTSRGEEPWVQFSPFYPHGGIPVPGMPNETSESVEGIWQGLKCFEAHGVDRTKFAVTNMKGIKRTVRKYGKVTGHQYGDELLDYLEARRRIYLPTYEWVLNNKVQPLLD